MNKVVSNEVYIMGYTIRQMKPSEYEMLGEFLYNAIFIPEGAQLPPRDIIQLPELQVYVADFGKHGSDLCLVSEVNGKVIGAVWARIMNDYGHVDDETPSLSLSVFKKFQRKGIGSELMKRMIELLKEQRYKQVSLSVQKANYVVRMYKSLGFDIVEEKEDELIMVCLL